MSLQLFLNPPFKRVTFRSKIHPVYIIRFFQGASEQLIRSTTSKAAALASCDVPTRRVTPGEKIFYSIMLGAAYRRGNSRREKELE